MDMIPPHVQRMMDAAGTARRPMRETFVSVADAHKIGDDYEETVKFVSGPAPASATPETLHAKSGGLLSTIRRYLPF